MKSVQLYTDQPVELFHEASAAATTSEPKKSLAHFSSSLVIAFFLYRTDNWLGEDEKTVFAS